jgi:hypothetical protein
MADEIKSAAAEDAGEPTRAEPRPAETASLPANEAPPKSGWSRRAFFQAAALGAAAAAFLDGKHFVPSIAFADDLSGLPCTANDVTIGVGNVSNEPCTCGTETFGAQVTFPVMNNTGSFRYCVTLHLPQSQVTLADGSVVTIPAASLPLGDAPPNQVTNLTATIPGFPCNAPGLVCIGGQSGTVIRGKCAAGQCATVAWNTSSNSACPDPSPPGGQCRHQAICIQGFGVALNCVAGCPPVCGGQVTLRATVTPPVGATSFDYTLEKDGVAVHTFPNVASTTQDFQVQVTDASASYTVTITAHGGSLNGCSRDSQPVVLTTSVAAKPTLSAGTAACDGTVVFSVTNCAPGLTYSFKEINCTTSAVVGTLTGNNGGCSLTHKFSQDGANHCVVVTVSNGTAACDVTSDKVMVHINAPVTVTLGLSGQGRCDGKVTFTAAPAGGTGTGYSFTFSDNGTAVQGPGSSNTLAYGPVLDGTTHTISVQVKDSAGCTSDPTSGSALKIAQCVTTTQPQ